MPDLDRIKQGEQVARDRRGPFPNGRSGNPVGRPRSCRDHVNRAARLLLAGEGDALTRKAFGLPPVSDPAALRLRLERIAVISTTQGASPSPGRDRSRGRVRRGCYPPVNASISASSGNRPSCFFEKTSFPSMVISNTPDTPLTSSTSSAPRSISLAFARRARGS